MNYPEIGKRLGQAVLTGIVYGLIAEGAAERGAEIAIKRNRKGRKGRKRRR